MGSNPACPTISRSIVRGFFTASLAVLGALPALAERPPFQLDMPLVCPAGERCPIEAYVDHDPGPGAKDYACGIVIRNGHSGIDIRVEDLLSLARGVPVVAAADGTVAIVQDKIRDHSPFDYDREEANRSSVCGNRVVLTHTPEWSTHYCHLRQGPAPVTVGQQVKAGDLLGYVGLSGATSYPHLHFNVLYTPPGQRLDIDPFAPDGLNGTCSTDISNSMWSPAAQQALAYTSPALINLGFAEGAVTNRGIENGTYKQQTLGPQSPALVVYARTIAVAAGDVQRLTLLAPDGTVLAENTTDPAEQSRLQSFIYTGRRLRAERWPAGTYTGFYEVLRDGQVVLSAEQTLQIP